ncbi:MAG TPA: NUDIX hydrolase [Actinomycetota bacterium]|nr:NUDIX hydrolase [Actinomycetota bacterium]
MAPQVAVGAIVVRDEKLLMIRRAKEPGAGLWSLPGGRVEHGEYLADALRREIAEETGLEVEVRDLVGILEVVGDPHYVILDYFAEVAGDASPVASGDASDARWVPLDEVASLPCTPRFHETLRGWGVLPG